MTQQLKVLDVLTEDLGLVPSTQTVAQTFNTNFMFKDCHVPISKPENLICSLQPCV